MKLYIFLLGVFLCFFVYPSSFIYPKDTLPDNNDTRLITYIINQVQNNLIAKKPLYEATFFAPEPNTLTYSDLFLTTSLLTLPARIVTNNPILIFNLGYILSFVLTFFSSFLFFHKVSSKLFGSLLATLLFNLSGVHLHYYSHLQVFNFWLLFAALYNLVNFLNSQSKKSLHLFLLFTTLQLTETIFTAYLLFFASLFFVLGILIKRRSASQNRTEHAHAPSVTHRPACRQAGYGFRWVVSFLPYAVVWLLLLLPYIKTHFLYEEATRSIRDAAHFSLGLEEIFTKYQGWATLTIIFVIVFSKRASDSSKNRAQICPASQERCEHGFLRSTKLLLLFSLAMSLGPALKIFGQTIKPLIPLPYALFYYLFPGFTGFRTPSRFILLALFAASSLVTIATNKHFNHLKTKTKIFIIFLVFIFLSLENHIPLTGYPINISLPTVYEEVKKLPKEAIILELPIKLWNMPDHQIESIRSLYSLEHKHKRLNGYSGFATLKWIRLVENLNTYGLTDDTKQQLKLRGVTHIIQNNQLSEI